VKITTPKRYMPETIIITINIIDKKRGQWILSMSLISGNITKANNEAITKGKIIAAVIFKTAPAIMQQIKTSRKKIARPEWKDFLLLIFTVCHK
jgi:hypothetical protein